MAAVDNDVSCYDCDLLLDVLAHADSKAWRASFCCAADAATWIWRKNVFNLDCIYGWYGDRPVACNEVDAENEMV